MTPYSLIMVTSVAQSFRRSVSYCLGSSLSVAWHFKAPIWSNVLAYVSFPGFSQILFYCQEFDSRHCAIEATKLNKHIIIIPSSIMRLLIPHMA